MRRVALHEAGHLVVCEALEPGSVGLASLRTSGRSSTNGFIHRCKELSKLEYNILISLAGKVAEELYYADVSDNGCQSDLERAAELIQGRLSRSSVKGLFMVDFDSFPDSPSEEFKARIETAVHAELENYMLRAKDILLKNRDFLEKAAQALIGKETLLYSDIRKIKESTTVTGAAA